MKLTSKATLALFVSTFISLSAQAAASDFVGAWEASSLGGKGTTCLVITKNLNTLALSQCNNRTCVKEIGPLELYAAPGTDGEVLQSGLIRHLGGRNDLIEVKLTGDRSLWVQDFNSVGRLSSTNVFSRGTLRKVVRCHMNVPPFPDPTPRPPKPHPRPPGPGPMPPYPPSPTPNSDLTDLL